jgi:hypothetical protein
MFAIAPKDTFKSFMVPNLFTSQEYFIGFFVGSRKNRFTRIALVVFMGRGKDRCMKGSNVMETLKEINVTQVGLVP